ncbi:ATP F0F1 synthase subunit B [Methyloligella sp. 2.7D]|uniref:F0F1 ATP synthase subunit B family protein n=1 Tax=unclassified Methyloligella TaxID=2625955 RepID=UPI00157C8E45|nr:ATP F0F1 synthase subunit B [Methyloligella sp. GL2]QKP78314.1 ATP F0F1 synthase subunit B [Methyloligella sp. GL2]
MPQLAPADWLPQLIWLAIVFAVFYVLMAKLALPKIGGVIDARRDKIKSDLETADGLRRKTEEAIAAYEQALAEAKQKAHGIAQEARDKLNAEITAEREKLEAELDSKAAEAEDAIKKAKESALKEVDGIATDVASDIVNSLIGVSPSKDETAKAVASARQG